MLVVSLTILAAAVIGAIFVADRWTSSTTSTQWINIALANALIGLLGIAVHRLSVQHKVLLGIITGLVLAGIWGIGCAQTLKLLDIFAGIFAAILGASAILAGFHHLLKSYVDRQLGGGIMLVVSGFSTHHFFRRYISGRMVAPRSKWNYAGLARHHFSPICRDVPACCYKHITLLWNNRCNGCFDLVDVDR